MVPCGKVRQPLHTQPRNTRHQAVIEQPAFASRSILAPRCLVGNILPWITITKPQQVSVLSCLRTLIPPPVPRAQKKWATLAGTETATASGTRPREREVLVNRLCLRLSTSTTVDVSIWIPPSPSIIAALVLVDELRSTARDGILISRFDQPLLFVGKAPRLDPPCSSLRPPSTQTMLPYFTESVRRNLKSPSPAFSISFGARNTMVQLQIITSSQPLLAIMAPAQIKYSALMVTPASRIIGPRAMGTQQMKYTSGYMKKAG